MRTMSKGEARDGGEESRGKDQGSSLGLSKLPRPRVDFPGTLSLGHAACEV